MTLIWFYIFNLTVPIISIKPSNESFTHSLADRAPQKTRTERFFMSK